MDRTLLVTKLAPPQTRPALVARPRLTGLWRQAATRPLTLVSAPAGYGKTTLVLEWLPELKTVAWLSLDPGDNDPVRFWAYMITALQTAVAGIGAPSLFLLQSPQPPDYPLVLTFLINELAALPDPLFLILDDYHFITNQEIHESATYFLDHLPAGVHLILISRADPPLPLARLRVRGQLSEIRERDLCFTLPEIEAFMQQVIGMSLTAGQLQSLAERTEGWVAGLQLSGLAGAGIGGKIDLFPAVSGSQHLIVDYLTEEVLARQSEQQQRFLLYTAVLDRFCAPLCAAVMPASVKAADDSLPAADFQNLLERLDRANLFLIPLDQERRWYRYHHLFADLLRFRAGQVLGQEALSRVHQQAAAWFAGQQLWPEAIDHALAAGEVEMAGRIIARQAVHAVANGELVSLKAWLAALPPALVDGDPRLCLAQAWVDLFTNRLDAAESGLLPVFKQMETNSDVEKALLGEAMAIRATIAFARQEAASTIADTEQALAHLPEEQLPLRTLLSWHLAFTFRLLGETPRAMEIYHQVIELSRRSGNFLIHLSARRELADIMIGQGDLPVAQTMLAQILEEAAAHQWTHLVPVAGAYLHLGEIYYEENHLATAVSHLQSVVSLPQAPQMSFDACALALLARAYAAQGNQAAANEAIQQAEQSVLQAIHPQRRILTLAHISRYWLAQGEVARAAAWLPDGRDIPPDPRHEIYARQQISHAHYHLALQNKKQAARLVDELLPAATAAGRVREAVELWLLKALLCAGEEAEQAVRRAVELAEPAGLLRTFLDFGPVIGPLLARLKGQEGISATYLHRLLAAFPPSFASASNRLLIEPLSERELEVLQLMAQGYSNREIADKLIFTIATAKKHAEHIYGKLGVNSRTQAIVRARELGLL